MLNDEKELDIFSDLSPSEYRQWLDDLNDKLLEEYKKHRTDKVIKNDIYYRGAYKCHMII